MPYGSALTSMNRPSFLRTRSLLAALAAASCAVLVPAQYTEVPATVAPGKFLLETDALSLVVDREGQEKFTGLIAGNVLLTTGLTSTWDIQVGAELYVSQRYESGNFTERRSGVGDVYVRTKWRFVENEFVSAAILPYAKIPTNTDEVGNDSVEGGVALPWETYLFGGFLTLNSMVDLSFVRNADDDGYEMLVYASSSDEAVWEFSFRLRRDRRHEVPLELPVANDAWRRRLPHCFRPPLVGSRDVSRFESQRARLESGRARELRILTHDPTRRCRRAARNP